MPHLSTRAMAGTTLFCLLSMLYAPHATADENMFGYTYGSDTLPKGGNEAYLWWTQRDGKGAGYYHASDVQVELEHGWTDHFQSSFYLTGRSYDYAHGAVVDESTGESMTLHRGLQFDGAKAEFKWSLKSPQLDGYGLAVYVEPEYSRIHQPDGIHMKEWGLETKLILQKNFLDDRLITAYNLTLEPEWEQSEGRWARELYTENSAGVSYRFASNWFAGMETRLDMAYPDYGSREFWAWFAGPALHYGGRRFWATLSWMPQIKGGPTDPDRSTQLHLVQREREEIRLKMGFEF